MAVTPKPIDKPYWATAIVVDGGGRTNIIAPPVGREPEGWTYLEKPPRNYTNHLWHWNGEWIDYQEAMTDAAQKAATKVVAAEDASDEWKQMADYTVGAGADAAITIELAVTNLPATGGRVLLSDGTFTCATQIDITKAGVWIMGQGPNTRIKTASASDVAAIDVQAIYTRLSDFLITTDSGALGANYANGVTASSANDLVCERIIVEGMYGPASIYPATPKGVAFYMSGCSGAIMNCRVELVSGGAVGTRSNECAFIAGGEVAVVGNRFMDANYGGNPSTSPCVYSRGNAGIIANNIMEYMDKGVLADVGRAMIVNNHMTNMTTAGVHLTGTSEDCVVDGNVIETSADGILTDSNSHTISGNEIKTMSGNGVHLNIVTNCNINGNKIEACAVGVEVQDAEQCIIANNLLRGCLEGIGFAVTPVEILIEGNLLEECPTAIEIGGSGHLIRGNQIVHTASGTVAIRCTATTDVDICGNYIRDFTSAIEAGGAQARINDNRILNGATGIKTTGTDAQVNGNHIEGHTGIGIDNGAAASFAMIEGNFIEGGTIAIELNGAGVNCCCNTTKSASATHILLQATCTASHICGNVCHAGVGPAAEGIYLVLDNVSGNTVTNNRLYGCAVIELRVIQAAALPIVNIMSVPETTGGVWNGNDARDNNSMTYASFAKA